MLYMERKPAQMTYNTALISVETDALAIEVSEGCLTIGTKQFPDDCISLTEEETEEVLKVLLRWKYGSVLIVQREGN
jgi:hypothetical protein